VNGKRYSVPTVDVAGKLTWHSWLTFGKSENVNLLALRKYFLYMNMYSDIYLQNETASVLKTH
jgi:hypothetical protein